MDFGGVVAGWMDFGGMVSGVDRLRWDGQWGGWTSLKGSPHPFHHKKRKTERKLERGRRKRRGREEIGQLEVL